MNEGNDSDHPQSQIFHKIERDKLPYREAAIGIVVDDMDRFLVVTHSAVSNLNAWRFPGGGVEKDETPEETILREVEEEFGTNKFEIVKKSSIMNQTDWPDETILVTYELKGKWWRGQRQHQFLLKFMGEPESIRPNSPEIREVKWATQGELPKLFIFPDQWKKAKLVIEELLGN